MPRLLLDVERKARPVVKEIHIYENVGGRSGIDPQPGRLPAIAKYRAPDGEVRRMRLFNECDDLLVRDDGSPWRRILEPHFGEDPF